MKLRNFLKASVAMAAVLTLSGLQAQGFPGKSMSMIVPYPAGGASDFVARKLQPDVAAALGQSMIVDNIGGAGGTIGLAKLLAAPADGHTMALGTPMELILAPLAIQGVKVKPEDFKLVAQIITTQMVLAVRPDMDVKNVDELIALARKSGDKPLSYGSVGPGSLYHLIGEKFSQSLKVPMLHVPYKGVAQVIPDLIGGQIDMAFLPLAGPIPATIADGKIKGLAVTSKTPHPLFKQLAPLAAQPGLAGMEFDLWAGIQVPRNTPDDAVNKLNKAIYASLQSPETRKALEATGNTVLSAKSAVELDSIYKSEIERYRAIAKSINLQPQ